MSVIDEALRLLSARLEEVEREARELRAAMTAVENGRARSTRSVPAGRYQIPTATPPTPAARTRARRGENRIKILAAIQHQAKTAGEIAAETGMPTDTAASTLLSLVRRGYARKATRGYIAAR